MKTTNRNLVKASALVLVGMHLACFGQGTFARITFDGPPHIAPGTQIGFKQYYESGMWFTVVLTNEPGAFFGRNGGGGAGYPYNGTAYIQGDTDTLQLYSELGATFGLVSVDLTEYSDVFHGNHATVPFVGYRPDGSAVTNVITTAGLYDQSFTPIFQTFYFPADFNGFTRVEIPHPYLSWSLDNLVLSVPEPCAPALFLTGALLWAGFDRRKARSLFPAIGMRLSSRTVLLGILRRHFNGPRPGRPADLVTDFRLHSKNDSSRIIVGRD